MAWLDGWTYRKQITIDNTNVDGNLTDFPLLVAFDNDTEVGTNSLSTGYDIRFTEADGTTLLKYERDQWYLPSPYENVVYGIGTPTHYWRMDDLVGTQLTDIAGKYHGVMQNAPTLNQTSAMPSFDGNPSIEFNGSNEYATFGSDVVWDSSGAMSASWWQQLDDYAGTGFPQIFSFKSDQAQVFKCFCSTTAGYDGVNFGANSGFGTWRSTGDISSDLLSGWHHIVVAFDGVDRTASGSYTLYVDGSVVAHVAASGFLANASTTYIARNISTSGYWDGKLDEIVVWDQELSQANVTALYDIGVPATVTATARIWVKSDLTSLSPTELYMYYGNAGASDGEDATNVWDSAFESVHHCSDAIITADTFSRADSTSLGTTETGLPWTETLGDLDIYSNQMRTLTVNGNSTAVIDISESDVSVSAIVTPIASSFDGVVVRSDGDDENCWIGLIRAGTNQAALYRVINNVYVAIDTFAMTITAGVPYTVRVDAIGTSIKVYIDDVERCSTTSSTHQTNTYVGLRGYKNNVLFNNFKTTTNPPTITNSTANSRLGTKLSVNNPIEIDGKIYKGQDFQDANDYITIANATISKVSPFTYSGWVYLDAFTDQYPILVNLDDGANGFWISFSNDVNYLGVTFGGNTGWVQQKTNTAWASLVGVWKHITLTYNGSGATTDGNFLCYIDGVLTAHNNSGAYGATANIGTTLSHSFSFGNWDGKMDESRLSASVRSADWIKFEYNNVENGELVIQGQQEENPSIANYGGIYLL